ncbi:hypothetical protein [Bartonella quintana]|uniref:hypothetical protein n=1 Tax=Bartonella quintana TaxID=803 RepID=UPI00027FCD5D|nr:hypothetical protein [Bartonella quintana]AFR26738.1 hypothetical protein RM11_1038 [Bartonella quintana RM-11]
MKKNKKGSKVFKSIENYVFQVEEGSVVQTGRVERLSWGKNPIFKAKGNACLKPREWGCLSWKSWALGAKQPGPGFNKGSEVGKGLGYLS